MKYLITSALALAAFTLMSTTAVADRCVDGSGHVVKKDRSVGDFHGIDLSFSAKVLFTQADEYSVTVEAEENLHEVIKVEIRDGHLKLKTAKGKCIGKSKGVIIHVSGEHLSELNIAGSGDFIAQNAIDADEFEVNIAGSGDASFKNFSADDLAVEIAGSGDFKVTGSGKVGSADYSIAGSGDIAADNVETKNANVSIAGSGDVRLFATGTLDVSIAGSGDVSYKGHPKVDKSVIGSGDIRHMD